MKDIKVKRNQNKELADSLVLGYTNGNIPIKICNIKSLFRSKMKIRSLLDSPYDNWLL